MPRPTSLLARLLVDTPGIRKVGRRVVRVYMIRTENGSLFYVRSGTGDRTIVSQHFRTDSILMKFLGLSKGQNVVDVGAHIGAFTVLAANLVGPEGRVVSFEPSTDNYLLFDRNLRANRIGNVIPFKVAIGSEAGFKQLHIYDKMASNSFFQRPDRKELRSETAQVRTLDSFMDGLMPPRVHAVKINVEGFETEVLMGARKLIERDAPRLVVMAHSFAESHDKVRAILVSFGYEVKEGRTADTLMASPSDRKAA